MYQISEIKYSFCKNTIFFIIEAAVILISFWLFLMLFLFSRENATQNSEYEKTYKDSQAYHISDNLYDDEEYSTFRKSPANIKKVSNFYELLVKDDSIIFAAMFDQQIPVKNFKGNETFDYGYQTDLGVIGKYTDENEEYQNVKCMQMNRSAYNQYNLDQKSDIDLFAQTINYNKMSLPVILGNDYQGIYNIGDNITVRYYFSTYSFEVIGFFKENTKVYYNGNINTSLDNYILVPYPDDVNDIDDMEFRGVLSLAMLNGDIIVEGKKDGLTKALGKLKLWGEESGFDRYDLWGVPQYVKQYQQIYEVITSNSLNIKQIFIGILLAGLALLSMIWRSIYQSRRDVYFTYHLMGFSINKIYKLIKIDLVFIPIISVFIFAICFIKNIIIGWRCSVLFIIGLSLLYCLFYYLSVKDFSRYLGNVRRG